MLIWDNVYGRVAKCMVSVVEASCMSNFFTNAVRSRAFCVLVLLNLKGLCSCWTLLNLTDNVDGAYKVIYEKYIQQQI